MQIINLFCVVFFMFPITLSQMTSFSNSLHSSHNVQDQVTTTIKKQQA